uniref:Uncharacterized protein n=1 Tax=Oncorhynchus tshawytscha TaxID=74940 RepID=A0AAZ3SJW0_ONCTS
MERREKNNDEGSTSWKQFQAEAKPILKESVLMFRKKKKHPLGPMISSSQPDLLILDLQELLPCGKEDHSSRPLFDGGSGSLKPTLVQSHHKSSSLGLVCLERLVAEPCRSYL